MHVMMKESTVPVLSCSCCCSGWLCVHDVQPMSGQVTAGPGGRSVDRGSSGQVYIQANALLLTCGRGSSGFSCQPVRLVL